MTQRELKFRVWDNGRKEWVHGPGNEVNLFGETIVSGEILRRPDDTSVSLDELNDLVALQYSGLKDKHGKEIYEGDRLRGEFNKKGQRITKERYGTVVFAFGGFHVIYDDEPKSHYNMTYKYRFEVIGNIYSNPELVEPKMIER